MPSLEDYADDNKINQKGKNTFHSLSYREKFGKYTLSLELLTPSTKIF
jgi:hypothetical protein